MSSSKLIYYYKFFLPLGQLSEILLFLSYHDWKNSNMIYHSTQSDDYFWHLILCGQKTENTSEYKFPTHFNG